VCSAFFTPEDLRLKDEDLKTDQVLEYDSFDDKTKAFVVIKPVC
jgi:hypothetical protein